MKKVVLGVLLPALAAAVRVSGGRDDQPGGLERIAPGYKQGDAYRPSSRGQLETAEQFQKNYPQDGISPEMIAAAEKAIAEAEANLKKQIGEESDAELAVEKAREALEAARAAAGVADEGIAAKKQKVEDAKYKFQTVEEEVTYAKKSVEDAKEVVVQAVKKLEDEEARLTRRKDAVDHREKASADAAGATKVKEEAVKAKEAEIKQAKDEGIEKAKEQLVAAEKGLQAAEETLTKKEDELYKAHEDVEAAKEEEDYVKSVTPEELQQRIVDVQSVVKSEKQTVASAEKERDAEVEAAEKADARADTTKKALEKQEKELSELEAKEKNGSFKDLSAAEKALEEAKKRYKMERGDVPPAEETLHASKAYRESLRPPWERDNNLPWKYVAVLAGGIGVAVAGFFFFCAA